MNIIINGSASSSNSSSGVVEVVSFQKNIYVVYVDEH